MHGEDLFVNDRSDGQTVEAIRKRLPELDIVPAFTYTSVRVSNLRLSVVDHLDRPTLVVEAVDPVDTRALVVSTQDEKVFRVFDLVCQQQADGLEGLLAPVYVIAEKEVVCFRWETAILE